MHAGKMDRRITIERRGFARNSTGEEVEGWSPQFQCWASVTWVGGGEQLGQGQRVATQNVQFGIRFRSGISPKDYRVVYDGATYEIEDVQETGRRDGLILTGYAREVVSGA